MKNKTFVWIGLALFLVFALQTNFFGTLVTSCELEEPTSLAGLVSHYNSLNYTVQEDTFIQDEGGSSSFLESRLPNGTKMAVFIGDKITRAYDASSLGCDALLVDMNVHYLSLNSSVTTHTDRIFSYKDYSDGATNISLWCTDDGELLIIGEDPRFIEDYISMYLVCYDQEIEDNQTNSTTNSSKEEEYPLSGLNELCGGPSASECDTGLVCEIEEDSADGYGFCKSGEVNYFTKENMPYLGLLLIFIAVYFIYERGPNKGLIRSRRRSRK